LPSLKEKLHRTEFFHETLHARTGRVLVTDVTCAFCLHSFAGATSTKMRVHLTGEEESSTRAAVCPRVPPACRDFYKAETDEAATKAQKRKTAHLDLVRGAIEAASGASDSQKKKVNEDLGLSKMLSAPANLRNVGQLRIDTKIVIVTPLRFVDQDCYIALCRSGMVLTLLNESQRPKVNLNSGPWLARLHQKK